MSQWVISFAVDLPDDVNEADVEAWAAFHVGATGELRGTNPLSDVALCAEPFSVWARAK